MNNTKPTQEQLKKFWEWCGFIEGKYYPDGTWLPYTPKDGYRLPSIHLNNLFKYAIPKLQDMGYQMDIVCLEHKGFSVATFNIITSSNDIIEVKNDKPELALFWAIWEVIKEG